MNRRIVLFSIFTIICESWSIPKPMESITNYNVMMVHGAYGPKNSKGKLQGFNPGAYHDNMELFGLRDGTNSVRITPSAKPNVVLNPESFVLYSNR